MRDPITQHDLDGIFIAGVFVGLFIALIVWSIWAFSTHIAVIWK